MSNFQFCPIFSSVQFSILSNFQFCPIFNSVKCSILYNFQLCPIFNSVQFSILSNASRFIKSKLSILFFTIILAYFLDESNPRPVFRWLQNGKDRDANRTEVLAGVFRGGEKITSIVEFRAGPEHNGMIYQCFAHNPTFFTEEDTTTVELNATIRLEVLCKYFLKTFVICQNTQGLHHSEVQNF